MKKYFLSAAALLLIAITSQAQTQPAKTNTYKQANMTRQTSVAKNNNTVTKSVTPAKTSASAPAQSTGDKIKRKHHKKTGAPKKTTSK